MFHQLPLLLLLSCACIATAADRAATTPPPQVDISPAIPLMVAPTVETDTITGDLVNGKEWVETTPPTEEELKSGRNGATWEPDEISENGLQIRSNRWTKKTADGEICSRYTVSRITKPAHFQKEKP